MVGVRDMLQQDPGKIASKIRRLVNAIYTTYEVVKHVYVCLIMPRADQEVVWQEKVRSNNLEIARMVCDVRKFNHRLIEFVPVHKVVLEKYWFFDMESGMMAVQVRIVKPIDRLFVPGTATLNLVGKYQVKAFLWQKLGILTQISMWDGMPVHKEPVTVTSEKRMAWEEVEKQKKPGADIWKIVLAVDTTSEDSVPPRLPVHRILDTSTSDSGSSVMKRHNNVVMKSSGKVRRLVDQWERESSNGSEDSQVEFKRFKSTRPKTSFDLNVDREAM